jgi:hypothetical protein
MPPRSGHSDVSAVSMKQSSRSERKGRDNSTLQSRDKVGQRRRVSKGVEDGCRPSEGHRRVERKLLIRCGNVQQCPTSYQ